MSPLSGVEWVRAEWGTNSQIEIEIEIERGTDNQTDERTHRRSKKKETHPRCHTVNVAIIMSFTVNV